MRIKCLTRTANAGIVERGLVALVLSLLFVAIPAGDVRPYENPGGETYPANGDSIRPQVLITNVFYESDIREALRDISIQAGVPIIADQSVQGSVTLEVTGLPLEQTLQRMLAPGGFTCKHMDGYYLVGAAIPDNPSFPLLSTTELIRPNYVKAALVPNLLSDFYKPFLKVDDASNTVAVTASLEIIDEIRRDLAAIDVPPKQVMIEALVTEFSKSTMKKLGIDWRLIGSGPDYNFGVTSLFTDRADSSLLVTLSQAGTKYHRSTYDLIATIQAMAEAGQVELHANPRVVTMDGQEATIFLGREEYYQIVSGPANYLYERLEVIRVGITLKIRPFVAENGDITVELEPEVSNVVGIGATKLPVISKRSVVTKVRVKNGETITIGGLIQKTERKTEVKIPLLGDIPILGYFFKSSRPSVDESEAVIFITPHILEK